MSSLPPTDTPLRLIRRERRYSKQFVADQVDISTSTLTRIESGETQPTRRVARALWSLYDGHIPLQSIYDPHFSPEQKKPAQ